MHVETNHPHDKGHLYRYSDKTAIYYVAELRLIPKWNPFNNYQLLKLLEVDWIQLVPFIEIGRVAPEWSISTLHSDMKKVVGLGLRFMAKKSCFSPGHSFLK